MSALCFNAFEVLSVFVTISYSSPEFLIAMIPIMCIFYVVKISYIQFSRQAKRLESGSNSPIYAHFNETVPGISTINTFGEVSQFFQSFEDLISSNLKYPYYNINVAEDVYITKIILKLNYALRRSE